MKKSNFRHQYSWQNQILETNFPEQIKTLETNIHERNLTRNLNIHEKMKL